jgi:hypothetical protein
MSNSIEPGEIRSSAARPRLSTSDGSDMPIRAATRAEEKQRRRVTPDTAQSDIVAARHNLYTADKKFPAAVRVYYSDYQQKSEVMRAKGDLITTKLDDRQTIGAMLDLAQSRGWQSVKLRGTDDFKREAWVQAGVRGMQTDGYKATNTDLQELERRKAAAAPVTTKEVPKEKPAPKASAKTADNDDAVSLQEMEKAVWGPADEYGKTHRDQNTAKPTEKAAEKAGEKPATMAA